MAKKKTKTQQSKRQRGIPIEQSLRKTLSKLKTKYHVGNRVKVKFEGIKKKDIACDTGTIVGIKWRFMRSDTHRMAMYQVVFDEPYFKAKSVICNNITIIWVGENSMKLIKEDSK